MWLLVLLMLLLYLSELGAEDGDMLFRTKCGKQQILRTSKVVGGNDTYDGEFPWTVSIRRNGNHHVRRKILSFLFICSFNIINCISLYYVNSVEVSSLDKDGS